MPHKKAMRSFYPSVEDLLMLEAFRGSVVVAGKKGLRRRVTGVNLSDTPNYYNWLSANEIIASTCYSIRNSEEAIRSFVPTVYGKKLAGIFLKPKEYLGKMPEIMIEQAEQLGIPLIELPDSVRLSSIVKAVFDEITKRENMVLRQSLSVNRMLIHTILGGADLQSLAAMLSEQVGTSIMILDTVNNRRAMHISPEDRKVFAPLEMEDAVLKLTNEAKEYPMISDGVSFGIIYIYCGKKRISKMDEQLLSQSMSAIPLEISSRLSLNEMHKRDFSTYVFHLFSDPIVDMKWEESRAESFGIKPDDAHTVLRMRISNGSAAGKSGFHKAQMLGAVSYALNKLNLSMHMLETDGEVIFIVDVPADQANSKKLSERIKKSIADICERYPQTKVTSGLGSIHTGLTSLINSNRQADLCVKIAERTGKDILYFEELGFLRMIYSENPEYEIYDFTSEILRDLIDSNRERNTELLSTLDSYLRNSGNVRQVSKEMFAHYNTVSYRLKKIEEITGRDLNDPDDRFLLELATRLLSFSSSFKPCP